ncbi:polyisoprenoid-binding protein YceI [Pseudoxanthomonas broegbernensis]|nr:YceI family protein [Pseudoxanthomonas broegbernensis]MBB6065434.1 polyisoprenoid-binding protein YceI [Pseudoxanthomonas broegbernensis]
MHEAVPPAPPLRIDTEHSHLGFEVRTRLGQHLEGVFPVYDGTVEALPDGRHQVRLRIATAAAEIPGRARYTAWMRGDSFFDSVRHPWMEFVSDPYVAAGLADGAALNGRLTLRGVTQDEALQVAPSACPRPGLDCAVWVSGDIQRSRYGMDDWRLVLSDRVLLRMQVRLKENPPP